MSGEYPGSISMLVDPNRDLGRVFYDANPNFAVVVHKTAGFHTAQEVAQFFATVPDKRSVHFVVGQDGVVVQCVLLRDGAGGNCCTEPGYNPIWTPFVNAKVNLNTITVSVEHVDPATDNSTPLTGAQKLASFSLIQWILKQKNIPASNVLGHVSIAPSSRAHCPGNYPMADLISFLEGGSMAIPNGWKDEVIGGVPTLVAPNGHKVQRGMREFVLTTNWDPDDLPLEEETYSTPVDVFDLNSGTGSNQTFTYDGLRYSQKDGVTYGPVGKDLVFYRSKAANLEAEVVQQQQTIAALKSGLPAADINNALTTITQLVKDLTPLVQ